MLDTKALAAAMAPIIKEAVAAAEGPLLRRIEALERRAPEKGEPGQNGIDGKDAEPVTEEQIARAVEQYLSANPPADGKDGADGRDGADGAPGEKGAPGLNGADGIGLAGAVIDRDGGLVVTLSNGEAKSLGPVVGQDGKDGDQGLSGKDGQDGVGFDDLEVTSDGERGVTLRFVKGERTKEFGLTLPVVLDRGVYSEAKAYERGDGVTWAGSYWIAQEATSEKPGDGAKSWRLAVKRGRDGKDFAGPQAKTPEKVRI